MGQAKIRGTLEQRRAQALDLRAQQDQQERMRQHQLQVARENERRAAREAEEAGAPKPSTPHLDRDLRMRRGKSNALMMAAALAALAMPVAHAQPRPTPRFNADELVPHKGRR